MPRPKKGGKRPAERPGPPRDPDREPGGRFYISDERLDEIAREVDKALRGIHERAQLAAMDLEHFLALHDSRPPPAFESEKHVLIRSHVSMMDKECSDLCIRAKEEYVGHAAYGLSMARSGYRPYLVRHGYREASYPESPGMFLRPPPITFDGDDIVILRFGLMKPEERALIVGGIAILRAPPAFRPCASDRPRDPQETFVVASERALRVRLGWSAGYMGLIPELVGKGAITVARPQGPKGPIEVIVWDKEAAYRAEPGPGV